MSFDTLSDLLETVDVVDFDKSLFQIGLGPDNPELIASQKKTADKILSNLQKMDPTAVLAGGAPRNWYLDKPAKDLDFFVYVGLAFSVVEITRWLSKVLGFRITHSYTQKQEVDQSRSLVGFPNYVIPFRLEETTFEFTEGTLEDWTRHGYLKNPLLRSIYEGEFEGCKVQIMLTYSPSEIWRTFPINLCRIAYDGCKYHFSPVFHDGVRLKSVVVLGDAYSDSKAYLYKIKCYFPDFKYYESVEDFISEHTGENWSLFPSVNTLEVYRREHLTIPKPDETVKEENTLPPKWLKRVEKQNTSEIRDILYRLECALTDDETKQLMEEYLRKLLYGQTSYI